MTAAEITERYDEIVDFSGLKTSSSTRRSRPIRRHVRATALAIAINVEPDLLIIDEILAVGDIDFQRKCTERFLEFRNSGRTTVLVTHDLESVRTMCDGRSGSTTASCAALATRRDRRRAHAVDVGARSRRLGSYREGSGEIQFTDITMSVGASRRSVSAPATTSTSICLRPVRTWRARRYRSR
jgi:ABC-2 type transport system ATP-binding protein